MKADSQLPFLKEATKQTAADKPVCPILQILRYFERKIVHFAGGTV